MRATSQTPAFLPIAWRAALAALAADAAFGLLYWAYGTVCAAIVLETSAVDLPRTTLQELVVSPLTFTAVLLVWLVGAPLAAALVARRVTPAVSRGPAWQPLVLSFLGLLPLVVLVIPVMPLGHGIALLPAGTYGAYGVLCLLVRALVHGGLSALGAARNRASSARDGALPTSTEVGT